MGAISLLGPKVYEGNNQSPKSKIFIMGVISFLGPTNLVLEQPVS